MKARARLALLLLLAGGGSASAQSRLAGTQVTPPIAASASVPGAPLAAPLGPPQPAHAPEAPPLAAPLAAPAGPGGTLPGLTPIVSQGPLAVAEAGCAGDCGGGCTVYGRAEYLAWWMRGHGLPPLVSTSPAGTARESAGVPGTAGYQLLFGDSRVDNDLQHGARFLVGFSGGSALPVGLEADFFFLGGDSSNADFSSATSPVLARPFIDAATGQSAASLVAFPGSSSGTVAVRTSTDLLGTGFRVRESLGALGGASVDVLGGFRYLRLKEKLTARSDSIALEGSVDQVPGSTTTVFDNFSASNNFYGADLGLVGSWQNGPFAVEVMGRVALGSNRRAVDITGNTTTTPVGGVAGIGLAAPQPGGLLALPTNIGAYDRSHFSVVPEVTIRVNYEVSDRLHVFAGYNFLYWTQVVRPGDQVDLTVNQSQLPPGTLDGTPRPGFAVRPSDFWAQGVTLGFEARY